MKRYASRLPPAPAVVRCRFDLALRTPGMARLLFLRQGQNVANLERRSTRDDDEPLTAAGLARAASPGSSWAKRFSCPLRHHYRRAYDTALAVVGSR